MPRSQSGLSNGLCGRNAGVQGIIGAVMVTAAATVSYFITGPQYQHVAPMGTDGYYLIRSINLTHRGPLGQHLLLQCAKHCLVNDSCSSFVVNPSKGVCNVTNLNRCKSRDNALSVSEGYFFYERHVDSEPYPPTTTCYSWCMERADYDCNLCGYPNCWGAQCDQCAKTCWERIDKTANVTRFIMADNRFTRKLSCNGNWQLWWWEHRKIGDPTGDEALELHVILIYKDNRTLGSYFDSVTFGETGELSVGNMTVDEGAGNWWQAPFFKRPLRRLYNTNCERFFTPTDTCVTYSIKSVEEQKQLYNGTVKDLGYPWLTGDQSYDSVPILKIDMWVKCAQCED